MKVLVTGSTGLVGTALGASLSSEGHAVVRLVRRTAQGADEIAWDPGRGEIDAARLEGLDWVVHLAGENIAARRWSPAQKARIRESRVVGTKTLCAALAGLARRPAVLVSASAIGIYGDRKDEEVDESSLPGSGFLTDVCRAWEGATRAAQEAAIRTVVLRFGVILAGHGGVLARMRLPFELGLGGRLGDGQQYLSWIAIDDAVGAIQHALATESLEGPVNAVAPHPVTNREFTEALGHVLHRPTILPVPAFAARLAFGELADDLLLTGQRVRPTALQRSGYDFAEPELEGALRHVLGK